MDSNPAYLLIAASFLFLLFGMIARTKSVRIALAFLGVALFLGRHSITSFPDQFDVFFVAALMTASIVGLFVMRSRVRHPPCIRVNDPYHSYRLVFFLIIFILIFIIVSGHLLFRPSGGTLEDLKGIILVVLFFVLIFSLFPPFPRYEICGNGIWYWGALHAWDQFESYTWTIEDDAVVELKYRKSFWRSTSGLVRLTVPPENSEAAKQLLEANLVNSGSEEAEA